MNNINLSNEFKDAMDFFITTLSELALLFIGISFIVSMINQLLPNKIVKRLLSGDKGYSIAVCLGIVTPFCSCSTLPMTIGLIKARAAFGPIMTFLFVSPLLNPFIIGLFWISFGAKTTLTYSLFVIALAIYSGVILKRLKFYRFIRKELLEPNCYQDNDENDTSINENIRSQFARLKWSQLSKEIIKQFISFMPYMILGVAIGAIVHGYVPITFFAQLTDVSLYILIPLSAFIGIFLYVRASTMVPIAASLAAKGMSMGAIMSLTIGGAGASLPEMIIMKKMFHWPLLLAFMGLVFTTAIITGFAVELI